MVTAGCDPSTGIKSEMSASAPNFIPSWANQPGVRVVNGDFSLGVARHT